MQKPINVSVDTLSGTSECIYDNVIKGDTLKMTIKIFQRSASLNLTGQSMHIILRKSDGYSVEKIITSVTGNSFDVNFDIQATLAVGDVEGEIQIGDSQGTNITNHFTFEVKPTLGDDIVIKSSDQIETLQQIIGLIASYNANADNLAKQNELAIKNKDELTVINNTSAQLDKALKEDIVIGQPLDLALKDDISKGKELDVILKDDTAQGKTTDDNLKVSIDNGNGVVNSANETIERLKQANTEYTEHIKNMDIHVTKAEKDKWNEYETKIIELTNIIDNYLYLDAYVIDDDMNNVTDDDGNTVVV